MHDIMLFSAKTYFQPVQDLVLSLWQMIKSPKSKCKSILNIYSIFKKGKQSSCDVWINEFKMKPIINKKLDESNCHIS